MHDWILIYRPSFRLNTLNHEPIILLIVIWLIQFWLRDTFFLKILFDTECTAKSKNQVNNHCNYNEILKTFTKSHALPCLFIRIICQIWCLLDTIILIYIDFFLVIILDIENSFNIDRSAILIGSIFAVDDTVGRLLSRLF